MKNAVRAIEKLFEEDREGYVLKNNVKNPFPTGYQPELDMTDELNDELASRYLQIISICQWAVELG